MIFYGSFGALGLCGKLKKSLSLTTQSTLDACQQHLWHIQETKLSFFTLCASSTSLSDHHNNFHPSQAKNTWRFSWVLNVQGIAWYKVWNGSQNLHQVYARLRIYVTAEKWNFSLFIPFTCENLCKLLSRRQTDVKTDLCADLWKCV